MNLNVRSPLIATARSSLRSLLVLSALTAIACGDDDEGGSNNPGDAGPATNVDAGLDGSSPLDATTPSGDAGDSGAVVVAPPTPAGSLFAVGTWVTTGEVTNAYIKVVSDLAVDQKVEVKTDSLEAIGFADIKVWNNKLFVSTGKTVTSYVIGNTGVFTKETTVDFSAKASDAGIYKHAFVSPTVAYLTGDNSWIRWNPTTLQIEPDKEIPFPATIAAREGITPFYSFDRGFVVRGNRIFQSIYWTDFVNYKMTASSAIAVIDTDTSKLLTVLDASCPGLDSASLDDAGNVYFSGWSFNIGATVVNGAAKGCAVRIAANTEVVDPSFKLTFADVTGGHEAIGLRYIGNDKFLLDVFREDRNVYNPATDKISDWLNKDNSVFATYDAVTREYKELPALGYHSPGYYSERLGEQFFLLVRNAPQGKTEFVQLLSDGSGKKGITVDGWSTRAYKFR
jgi:hypothetical protein